MKFPISAAMLLVSMGSLADGLGQASAAEITRSSEPWSVKPAFKKNAEARTSLSGVACVDRLAKCLAVNDEKKYAQFFSISGRTIVPKELIRLLPDEVGNVEMDEIDAEGATYSKPHVYVVGSHGRSRKGKLRSSVFHIFRFPVLAETGEPSFSYNDEVVAPEIERTADLRALIANNPTLAPYAERSLANSGVTIEGLASRLRDGGAITELFLGLRSPVGAAGENYIIHVENAASLFDGTLRSLKLIETQLEPGVGIRDLVAVKDGFLILAGNSLDPAARTANPSTGPAVAPSLWLWDGVAPTAEKLGALPGDTPADAAEGLLVLDEMTSSYRILVMYDGKENGSPIEFDIRR